LIVVAIAVVGPFRIADLPRASIGRAAVRISSLREALVPRRCSSACLLGHHGAPKRVAVDVDVLRGPAAGASEATER
jgi:hypothetical protein